MKIYLIGLPGCGKSYWARQLATHYQLPLIDLDAEIVKETGLSINDIFINHGEKWFRQKEADLLRICSHQIRSFIFSTGGGAPCFHNNMRFINDEGISIFINRSPQNITQRLLAKGFEKRPLLRDKKDTLTHELNMKLQQRKPYYEQAKTVLSKDDLLLDDFVNALEEYKK